MIVRRVVEHFGKTKGKGKLSGYIIRAKIYEIKKKYMKFKKNLT